MLTALIVFLTLTCLILFFLNRVKDKRIADLQENLEFASKHLDYARRSLCAQLAEEKPPENEEWAEIIYVKEEMR